MASASAREGGNGVYDAGTDTLVYRGTDGTWQVTNGSRGSRLSTAAASALLTGDLPFSCEHSPLLSFAYPMEHSRAGTETLRFAQGDITVTDRVSNVILSAAKNLSPDFARFHY